jgi:hypothetical protein
VQLALELHADAPAGETETEFGDLDVDAADAAAQRLLEAVLAATTRAAPCRCLPAAMVLDGGPDEPHCARCGRAVEAPA